MAHFFTNFTEITPGAQGSWVTIDLSSYIPEGATVVCVRIRGGGWYGFRAYGSTYDNYFTNSGVNGYSEFYTAVSTDRKIQIKRQNTNVYCYLCGYFTSDAIGFSNPYQIASDLTTSWAAYDLNSYVPLGAKFAVLEILAGADNHGTGIRAYGSTDTQRTWSGVGWHYGYIIALDNNRKVEAARNVGPTKLYLHGYITNGKGKINGLDKSPATGSYQTIDMSADHPPWGYAGALVQTWTDNGDNPRIALRAPGSTDDMYYSTGNVTYVAGMGAAKTFECKRESTHVKVYVLGYFSKPYKNVDLVARNWVGEFNNQCAVSGSVSDSDNVKINHATGDNEVLKVSSALADMGTFSSLNLITSEIMTRCFFNSLSDNLLFSVPQALGDSGTEYFVSAISNEYLNLINTYGGDLAMLFIKQPLLLERILHFSLDIAEGHTKGLFICNKIVDSGIEAMLAISSGISDSKTNSLPLTISEGWNKFLSIQSKIVDSGIETMLTISSSLSDTKDITFTTMIAEGINKTLALLTSMADPVNSTLYVTNTIEDHLHIPFFLRNSLAPVPVKRVSPVWDLTLEGVSIKRYTKKINMDRRESEPIDQIEIELAGLTLWDTCNPATNYGELRIKLTINSNEYQFYLESREKNESAGEGFKAGMNIWGRQKTAILAEGFATKLTGTYSNKYASEIAVEIAGDITLTWDCDDYWISTFTADDYPLNVLVTLAEGIGAVVRTKMDGSLTVRSKFPVTPDELLNETAIYSFDRTGITSLDYAEEQPEFNAVTVNLSTNSAGLQKYSIKAVDGTCARPGETLQMKVYIPSANALYSLNVSGTATATKIGTYSESEDEEVKYYDLWELTSAVTETVSLSVSTDTATSSVTVIMGGGGKEAGAINNALITTESQASTVGELYLYEHYYRRKKYTIDVPYSGVEDGKVATVDDEAGGTFVRGIVREASLEISLSGGAVKLKEIIKICAYEEGW
ncbi:MAG: hypothetical protein H7844_00930 [Nitrospirae bacterium YQR-1]